MYQAIIDLHQGDTWAAVGCREGSQPAGGIEEMKRERSHTLFERARQLMPGGVNSPARAFGGVGGEPIVVERGEGRICGTSTAIGTSITSARGGR